MKKYLKSKINRIIGFFFLSSYCLSSLPEGLAFILNSGAEGISNLPKDAYLESVPIREWKESIDWHKRHLNLLANSFVHRKDSKSPKNFLFLRLDFILCKTISEDNFDIKILPLDFPCGFLSGWHVDSRVVDSYPPEAKNVSLVYHNEQDSSDLINLFPKQVSSVSQAGLTRGNYESDEASSSGPSTEPSSITDLERIKEYLRTSLLDIHRCFGYPERNLPKTNSQDNFKIYLSMLEKRFNSLVKKPDNEDRYPEYVKLLDSVADNIRTSTIENQKFKILDSEQGMFHFLFEEDKLEKFLKQKSFLNPKSNEKYSFIQLLNYYLKKEGYTLLGITKHVASWYDTCCDCGLFYSLQSKSKKLEETLEQKLTTLLKTEIKFKIPVHTFISSLVNYEEDKNLFFDCETTVENTCEHITLDPNQNKVYKHKRGWHKDCRLTTED